MVELKGSKHFLLNGCVLKNLSQNKALRVKHHHSIKSNKNFFKFTLLQVRYMFMY